MKKNIIFILIMGLLILIPNKVQALEYTFKIGPNGDYNEQTINLLQDRLDELDDEDYNDNNKIDNKYILEFEDGNYDFGESDVYADGIIEYHFGVGSYKYDFEFKGFPIAIYGQGIDKTKISTNYFGVEVGSYIIINDVTINIDSELDLGIYGDSNESKKYGIEQPVLFMKNVVFNTSELSGVYFNVSIGDIFVTITIDNVTFNGGNLLFEFENDGYLENEQFDYINIINSDFSKTNLTFKVDGKVNRINIENSKLNKIYAGNGITVQIDCNSTFENGTSRGKGELWPNEALNQYNIYEYQDELYPEHNGQIITSACKKKEIKITDRVKLEDLNKDLGLDIDGTWIAEPEGIIQINNNELVPIKIGKTILSKEIDGIINNVTIDVIEDNTISVPDTIKNPNTGTGMYVVIPIIILAINLSLYLVMKKRKTTL